MFIIPKPQEMICFDEVYELNQDLKTSKTSLEKIERDADFFGIDIKVGGLGEENIFFYENPAFKDEEYEFFIDVGGIKIISASEQGTFRALSTLKQILGQKDGNKLPCLKIHDFPDLKKRGIMLYVRQNYIYTMETLFEIVDRMAELKYNMLQLYFDTFVFEYDSFRKYLDGKVYYTTQEIHKLDEYCKAHHIELVANVETFGHMSELLACNEFKHLGITRDNAPKFSLNPLLDESFDVVKRLLDDLLPHFSSPLVHIGMDETYGLGGHETEEYCKAFGVDGPFVDFLKKVSGYAKEKHGKRSMFWGDMAVKYPRCMKDIPKDVIFVDWGYEPGHKFERTAIACKEAGLEFYVAPGTQNWGTITGRTDLMIQNIFEAAEVGRFYGASGFLLADWFVTVVPTIQLLPYTIGAAFSWNSGYSKTFADSDNEMDCYFKNNVIQDTLKYIDKFVLKSEEISCAELIYRMGNYYFMEQPITTSTWNGTLLYKCFANTSEIYDYQPPTVNQLKRIKNYMNEIKAELKDCVLSAPDSERRKMEIEFACDVVLFASEAILKRKPDLSKPAYDIDFDVEGLMERCIALENVHYRNIVDSGWKRLIKKWADIK